MITSTLLLASPKVRHLFHLAGNFHDADLSNVSTREGYELALTIRYPVWFASPKKLAAGTVLTFRFKQPLLAQNWGSDIEICACMIYDFELEGNRFNLQTGDGGRTGSFDLNTSTVEVSAPKSIVEALGLAD